ncbi:FecR family protein [Reyranella sp.]|uniref:FecR family protein n=1 Tax=Reyranella sp. TaxID=1929291 RepID=UPI003BAC2F73
MEDGPVSAQAKASREASGWLILLQEDPDDQDLRRRFEEWLATSPLNVEAWSGIRHVSAVARTMQPEFPDRWLSGAANRGAGQRGDVRRRDSETRGTAGARRRRALAGIVLALAACLAIVAGPALVLRLEADQITGTAEQRRVGLEDGSVVTLAADSAIAVFYDAAERRVRLLTGEAFFDVVPDAGRPFRVVASTVTARALGTSYGVRLEGHGVSVAVAKGTVEVASVVTGAAAPTKLTAGQAARVSEGGRVSRTSVPLELVAPWRRGQFYLQDQTLRDAVDQLRRYYAGTIILADEALAERRVTGVYNLDDPEDALRGIARAHGATVRRITPWLIVLSGS